MEKKLQRRNKKESRGITLIALIITIIVMLILVAVSISIALQTGLFEKTGKAAKDTKNARDEEQQIASGKVNIGGVWYDSIDDYIAGRKPLPEGAGKKVANDTTYKYNSDGKTATIPGGFTPSGKNSESHIDDGLVIYLINDKTDEQIAQIDWEDEATVKTLQETYDQFVWIPISHEQINNMYICQAKTESNGECNITVVDGKAKCTEHNSNQMAGRLYASRTGETFEQDYTELYIALGELSEPAIVTSNGTKYDNSEECLGILNNILETSFATTTDTTNNRGSADTDFKTYLQEEYNDIVKSVYENEGFYCRKI